MAKGCTEIPVVNLSKSLLLKKIHRPLSEILEALPYIGLDIEGSDDETIRVEYNPNRPDFSSEFGIIRGLNGLLDLETGFPGIRIRTSNSFVIRVDQRTAAVRPHIGALAAKDGHLDDAAIKQLVAMQEDLHNGIGRRRRKASIGFHNLDVVRFPLNYTVRAGDFSFSPLGTSSEKTIQEILEHTDVGLAYRELLSQGSVYPILEDNSGVVMALPPIINGNVTRIDENTHNLFVDVTGSDEKTVNEILAVIAYTLHDAGFKISSVTIKTGKKSVRAPQLKATTISTSPLFINGVLGTQLSPMEIRRCLKRSRIGTAGAASRISCRIPAYRVDISAEIDLAEEVAIGHGISKLSPSLPASTSAGQNTLLSRLLVSVSQCLVGFGMLETLSSSLVSEKIQYGAFDLQKPDRALSVESSKSAEHQILRESLIPSLLQVLSRNIHEEYPQRLFEIGKVFSADHPREKWAVAGVVAHSRADFTEAKSLVQALVRTVFGLELETRSSDNPLHITGRSAQVRIRGVPCGNVGEISLGALDVLRLRIPVSAFEIDLDSLFALPQNDNN